MKSLVARFSFARGRPAYKFVGARQVVGLWIIAAALLFSQLHALSHLEQSRDGESLKTNCEICDVRSHTPSVSNAAVNLLPELPPAPLFKLPLYESYLDFKQIQLPPSCGPPLSPQIA